MSEDFRNILEEKLQVGIYLNSQEQAEFYQIISEYLQNRSSLSYFSQNLDELIKFFNTLGYDTKSVIEVIKKWPAIIHADKNHLFYKYLIMGKVVNENNESIRDDSLLNHAKDFMISTNLLYARVKYLIDNPQVLRDNIINRRKVITTTNKEFVISYNIDKNSLLENYPFNREALEEVLLWEENQKICQNLYETGRVKHD